MRQRPGGKRNKKALVPTPRLQGAGDAIFANYPACKV